LSIDGTPIDPTPGIGTTGRRFHIHSCLGRGGFGEVYRATMMSSGGVRTEVAIKVLRGDIDPGSDSVKRLRDEGRLLGALRHPAILRVHDLVLLEERVALVTEFVEGEDLDGCLKSGMPLRSLVGVVGEVAAALDVAWNAPSPHGTGEPIHLVHRDVKPANIRVGRHGEVKLLDFGIARATNVAREAQTANNAMMGSYLYMSPERFHEERVEPPADVYALGCILYEGIAGQRLFDGMTLKQIYGTMLLTRKFNAHLQARFEALPADLDPTVRQLLVEMLAADPAGQIGRAHV
jgi:serine/threonine-protein kinase